MIDYEQDRVQSVTQTDAAKSLSDKLMTLPDRVSSLFAAETDHSVIGKTLKEEIVLAINSSIKQFA